MTETVRPRHRMVDRVAAILELVARSNEGLTLTDIAHTLNYPLSTTQGLVNGLTATGYLDESNKRYTLGMAPFLLNVMAGRRMVNVPTAELEAIHDETGLITVLALPVGGKLFYLKTVGESMRYQYLTENFLPRSLLRTSAGWVLMSRFEKRELWSYLNSARPEDQAYVDDFLRHAGEIAETGVCAAPGIAEGGGVDGVSIAVEEDGATVAAVCVFGSPDKIAENKDELVEILQRHRGAHGKDDKPAHD
ncbi:MAG: helix-turn-helix domain-containing protein [Corynebacterium sp.]|uniref:helix-turn-helix domain-containing protein n=1 Tax=Corynebacterium sp. TaxID=1720 RepID=UPI0026DD5E13|nr:helix-turn-helix domain-containing protein [Corynebacterium sp.]MDO5029599.1 helix-turn-helix domain-containing protein [Corynebacterium sp.]